jgi:hypothetical protein
MKPESFRVHPPSTVVFLCGGATDKTATAPISLRDAFYRVTCSAPPGYKIVLAEEANPLTSDADYHDLFRFESDIAQLVGLILLFAESAGSLAELGAFSALPSVAPSLLAVIDDVYYSKVSFIRDGPVRHLEKVYGDDRILTVERAEVGIGDDASIENLNAVALSANILPAVEKRLAARSSWTKFDADIGGHVILLMIGLCQEYGALTQTEIKSYLERFGVKDPRFSNYVYCAELLGWLKKIRKSNHIFYVAVPAESALDYQVEATPSARDKIRWRADIRDFWRKHDAPRLKAISDVASASTSSS